MGQNWLPVQARQDRIVCNIGDQLMRVSAVLTSSGQRLTTQWSDDRLKSTYHRVRLPEGGESRGPRYSLAFFNQARSDVIIQGPAKKYPPITGGQFIAEAMARNRLQSAEVARAAALLDSAKVASEVHFVPEHLRAEVVV
jgi:isopenicillin N synthase-like dioxygenase